MYVPTLLYMFLQNFQVYVFVCFVRTAAHLHACHYVTIRVFLPTCNFQKKPLIFSNHLAVDLDNHTLLGVNLCYAVHNRLRSRIVNRRSIAN